jgi:hypothetical protein
VGSSAKQRTTAAKLNREAKLRLRRAEKEARKAARRRAPVAERDAVTGSMEGDDADRPSAPESERAPVAPRGSGV